MARGEKIGCKRESRNKVRLGKKDSDEDYTVGADEEFIDSEDEDCSLAEDESDDSFLEFFVEEGESRVKEKVGKLGCGKGSQRRRSNGAPNPKKKKVSDSEGEDYDDNSSRPKPKRKNNTSRRIDNDDDEDDDDFLYGREINGFDVGRTRKRKQLSCVEKYVLDRGEKPRVKTEISYQEEEEYVCDESDEDYDEEFAPDEIDVVEEEDIVVTKKNKAGKLQIQETDMCKGRKRKKNIKVLKKAERKKPKSEKVSRKNNRFDHGDFRAENQVSMKNKMIPKHIQGRRRKQRVDSDPDFLSSGSSDYEYTVSEEEREHIREASDFCGRVTSGLRNLNSLKMIEEEVILPMQRICPGRKGKEKVVDMKIVVGKQVCGICLSEEGKKTVRGVLNCCSHYFCFACIVEWSKVESRCPLCKQRFTTVCRTFQEDGRHDLRDSVIQVPERDQVYQPSEEELGNYLDPYENVLCTECLQGGDDALMLLCDVCDSPAHSYCVGLGREVPEGNWYCDGCRPIALASVIAQPLSSTPDPGASHILPVGSSPVTVRETFDLNELYVPDTPLSQVAGHSPSPRQSIGDIQAASPGSGFGAFTVFERRQILRQIQSFRSRNRQLDNNISVPPASTISLFGSQISCDGSIAPQHLTSSRIAPSNIFQQTRLPDNASSSLYRREAFSPRLRRQVLYNQASTPINPSFDGLSHGEFVGINARIGRDLGRQQLHPCTSNTSTDSSLSAFPFGEASVPSRTLQEHLRTPF